MGDEELVTLIQAAREVDLSRERLRQLIRDGDLTATKVGRGFRLTRDQVEQLKLRGTPKPGPRGPRKHRPAPPDAGG
jgi:excisionase family DNA binding protein